MRQVEKRLNDVFEDCFINISVHSANWHCSVNEMVLSSSMSRSQGSSYCEQAKSMEASYISLTSAWLNFFFCHAVVKCTNSDKTIRKQLKLALVKWYRPHSWKIARKRKTGLCCFQNAFYTQYIFISVYRIARRVVPCSNSFLIVDLQVWQYVRLDWFRWLLQMFKKGSWFINTISLKHILYFVVSALFTSALCWSRNIVYH